MSQQEVSKYIAHNGDVKRAESVAQRVG